MLEVAGSRAWRQASRAVAGLAVVTFCYTVYLVLALSLPSGLVWAVAGTLLIAAEIAVLAGLVVTARRTQRSVMGPAGLALFGVAVVNLFVVFVAAMTVLI